MEEYIKSLGYNVDTLNSEQKKFFSKWYKDPGLKWLIEYHLRYNSTPTTVPLTKVPKKRYNFNDYQKV